MTRVFVTVLTVVLLGPVSAEAALWDWIKELSGPGPSTGGAGVLGTVCVFHRDLSAYPPVSSTAPIDTKWNRVPCLFVDRRSFENGDDDNFPNRVRLQAWDFGVTWKRRDGSLEIGGGAGFMRFLSDDRIHGAGQVITRRFTLNGPRVVVAPVRLIFPKVSEKSWRRLSRVLKLYGRVNVIPGTIEATDFGVPLGSGPGQSTFSERNDTVWSHGFIIDLGELISR